MARYDIITERVVERNCYICNTSIYECMGFTRAGDFDRFLKGEQNYVREACGICTERIGIFCGENFPTKESELDEISNQIRERIFKINSKI